MAIVCTMDELGGLEGRDLGASSTRTITQSNIDDFARLTGDHQWIHIDPVRSKETATGTTIVHGYLALGLLGQFWTELLTVSDCSMALNYGLDRVRFISPIPVGSSLYMTGTIIGTTDRGPAVRLHADVAIRMVGAERPAIVATSILHFSA